MTQIGVNSLTLEEQVQEQLQSQRRSGEFYTLVKIGLDATLLILMASCVIIFDSIILKLLAATVCGILMVSWFEAMHWCVHNSLFQKSEWNKRFGHICGAICFMPYTLYKSNHLGHHKHLGDAEHDPEKIEGGQTLDTSLLKRIYALLVFNALGVLKSIYRIFWVALSPSENLRGREFSYVSPLQFKKLVKECRVLLVIYSVMVLTLLNFGIGEVALLWLYAIWIHCICHYIFSAPEHAGINDQPSKNDYQSENTDVERINARNFRIYSQLSMTRLFTSGPIVHFLRWNENYHAAHHAFPSAPYYLLPSIAKTIGPKFSHTHGSYFGFLFHGDQEK